MMVSVCKYTFFPTNNSFLSHFFKGNIHYFTLFPTNKSSLLHFFQRINQVCYTFSNESITFETLFPTNKSSLLHFFQRINQVCDTFSNESALPFFCGRHRPLSAAPFFLIFCTCPIILWDFFCIFATSAILYII